MLTRDINMRQEVVQDHFSAFAMRDQSVGSKRIVAGNIRAIRTLLLRGGSLFSAIGPRSDLGSSFSRCKTVDAFIFGYVYLYSRVSCNPQFKLASAQSNFHLFFHSLLFVVTSQIDKRILYVSSIYVLHIIVKIILSLDIPAGLCIYMERRQKSHITV